MTRKEELIIKSLELIVSSHLNKKKFQPDFISEQLSSAEFKNVDGEEMGNLVLGELTEEGYLLKGGLSKSDSPLTITRKGELYLQELKEKKKEEEIAKLMDESDRVLARLANRSSIDTNKSVINLNKHQRVNIWIMALIGVFAAWIGYNQFKNDLVEKRQTKQEQEWLQKIESQIHALNYSLDSMSIVLKRDTLKK